MGCYCSKKSRINRINARENKKAIAKKEQVLKILNLPSDELHKLIINDSDISDYLNPSIMFKSTSNSIYIYSLGLHLPIRVNSNDCSCFPLNLSVNGLNFKTEYVSYKSSNYRYILTPKYSFSYKLKLLNQDSQNHESEGDKVCGCDDKECKVCFSSENNMELRCGHQFCSECVLKIYNSESANCPMCREKINKSDIYNSEPDDLIYHPFGENYYALNNKKCLICKDKIANKTTECGHHYCFECIVNHVMENNCNCPECDFPILH